VPWEEHTQVKEGVTMKVSIWTWIASFGQLEPEILLERLARTGWKYLEFSMNERSYIEERPNPEKRFEALRQLCEELGVCMLQLHGPQPGLPEFSPAVSKGAEYRDAVKRTLRHAKILGVEWVVLHPGGAYWPEDTKGRDKIRKGNLEFFSGIAKYAESLKVGIAIENLTLYRKAKDYLCFGGMIEDLIWLAEQIDSERVGICLDTGHANGEDMDQAKAIRAMGKYLKATHINDNDSLSDQHRLPFDGTVNWKEIMKALRDIGYKGLFNLEVGGATYCLQNSNMPLEMKEAKLRYILELTKNLISKDVTHWS
jgi:sugar phosphate isomerase/epimerase